jgi:hypothetical protein
VFAPLLAGLALSFGNPHDEPAWLLAALWLYLGWIMVGVLALALAVGIPSNKARKALALMSDAERAEQYDLLSSSQIKWLVSIQAPGSKDPLTRGR